MTDCGHRLDDAPGGPTCNLLAGHSFGHVYIGSSLGDAHTVTEEAAERRHEL